ncbi:unnamed protein product [Camellia sinensis]
MEEQDRPSSAQASSSSSSTVREFSGDAATSSSAFPVREAAAEEAEHHDRTRQQNGVSYHVHYPTEEAREISPLLREDAWSCMIVVFTFWFFVVEQLDEAKNGPILYGFYKEPQADVELTWSQTHNTSLPSGFQKEWIYIPSSIILIIAQGSEGFAQWLEDPSYPNSTLSWNIINGSGIIQQDIWTSASYYVAVGNLNSEEVEVQLNLKVKAILYNTTEAYYNCAVACGACNLKMLFPSGNAVVLTSPGPEQHRCHGGNLLCSGSTVNEVEVFLYDARQLWQNGKLGFGHNVELNLNMSELSDIHIWKFCQEFCIFLKDVWKGTNVWQVQLSYGPRWLTYLVGIGGLTLLVLSAFYMFNNFQCTREEGTRFQFGEMRSERAPLLQKDDDLSSWGSSCDSVSQDDEDLEDELALGSLEGMPLKDGEYNNNIRRLCAICFDAPRDCFFLPCGHCVACFACGTRQDCRVDRDLPYLSKEHKEGEEDIYSLSNKQNFVTSAAWLSDFFYTIAFALVYFINQGIHTRMMLMYVLLSKNSEKLNNQIAESLVGCIYFIWTTWVYRLGLLDEVSDKEREMRRRWRVNGGVEFHAGFAVVRKKNLEIIWTISDALIV